MLQKVSSFQILTEMSANEMISRICSKIVWTKGDGILLQKIGPEVIIVKTR